MSHIFKFHIDNKRLDALSHNNNYDCSVRIDSNKRSYFILCNVCFWRCTVFYPMSEKDKIQVCHDCKNDKLSSTPISSTKLRFNYALLSD
jgi:hypothetical protein